MVTITIMPVTILMIFILITLSLLNIAWSFPVESPTATSDFIGEAFRKELSRGKTKNGTGVEDGTFIDRLSSEEIIKYQKTGRLPNRTRELIQDFLRKTRQGQKLLHLGEIQLPLSEQSHSSKSESLVALQPSDRYEIIDDRGDDEETDDDDSTILLTYDNEHDENFTRNGALQSKTNAVDRRKRRRRRLMKQRND